MKKIVGVVLVIIMILNCMPELPAFAVEEIGTIDNTIHYNNDACSTEIDNQTFELGNSSLAIFQRGRQVTKDGVDYYARVEGLLDRNQDIYLTNYQVYNLNYIEGILYYSVNETNSPASRIERYDTINGEKEVLYTHPEEIWEMYCINNDFILFVSAGRLFRFDILSSEIKGNTL